VDCALNGEEALEKVEERVKKYDSCYKLILMDINMPRMDGFECTKILNNHMAEGKIP
jgi:CheY-like chemotaxis protein